MPCSSFGRCAAASSRLLRASTDQLVLVGNKRWACEPRARTRNCAEWLAGRRQPVRHVMPTKLETYNRSKGVQ